MGQYAVIDLGTNTFHLLIVETTTQGFKELRRERRFIKLAENGIERIGAAPYQRGLNALIEFRSILDQYPVQGIRAFGTAALRTAENGVAFIEHAREQAKIDVLLIPGKEEARLIHLGVGQAIPALEESILIMDIGGGSVEFIIADGQQVHWSQSFPIGVAVLFRAFHQADPITPAERTALRAFLENTLGPLKTALQTFPAQTLVGASGTFDVLEALLPTRSLTSHGAEMLVEHYFPFWKKVQGSTQAERLQMPGMPKDRADMIVVALELVAYIIELAQIERIWISQFAMKEGMLAEMIG
ncbi:MAG: phosphatase [Bacteroidota bacterium]